MCSIPERYGRQDSQWQEKPSLEAASKAAGGGVRSRKESWFERQSMDQGESLFGRFHLAAKDCEFLVQRSRHHSNLGKLNLGFLRLTFTGVARRGALWTMSAGLLMSGCSWVRLQRVLDDITNFPRTVALENIHSMGQPRERINHDLDEFFRVIRHINGLLDRQSSILGGQFH